MNKLKQRPQGNLPTLDDVLSSAALSSTFPPPRSRGRSRAASSRRQDELMEELRGVEQETERLRSISQRASDLGLLRLEPSITVTLPTLEMRNSAAVGSKEKLYVAYIIDVRTGSVHWRLARRFSEFYNLHNMLRKGYKRLASILPKLPSKRMKLGTSKFDPKYTLERREKLETYLVALVEAVNVDANDIIDDFLEYTEHIILSSVSALRTMQGEHGNKVADMLQSSMKKTHKRHFSRHSSHANQCGSGSGSGGNGNGNGNGNGSGNASLSSLRSGVAASSDLGDSSDDEIPASELPSAREMRLNDEDIVAALEEMSLQLDMRLQAVESLKEDLEARVLSQENALTIMKRDLQAKRLLCAGLTAETQEMESTYKATLKGLTSRKSRMSAEKKVLVVEIKSLRKRQKETSDATKRYTKQYGNRYEELSKAQTAPEHEQSERHHGERALEQAILLRSALVKLDTDEQDQSGDGFQKETEITRVQALVQDIGVGSPHQEIVVHLRELLHSSCNLQMEHVSLFR